MNKYNQLKRQTTITAGIGAAIVAAFGIVYFLADNYASSATIRGTDAQSAFDQDQSQITTLRGQLEQSGEAEKRFATIQFARNSLDFTANGEALKDWLRNAKAQYRFSNAFKLSVSPEKISDKPDLNGMDYTVTLRPAMKLEFEAISDVHVYSFLEEFLKQSPGIIRLTSLHLTRKGDLDPAAIDQISRGYAAFLVDSQVEFTWIGVAPKAKSTEAAEGQTP